MPMPSVSGKPTLPRESAELRNFQRTIAANRWISANERQSVLSEDVSCPFMFGLQSVEGLQALTSHSKTVS